MRRNRKRRKRERRRRMKERKLGEKRVKRKERKFWEKTKRKGRKPWVKKAKKVDKRCLSCVFLLFLTRNKNLSKGLMSKLLLLKRVPSACQKVLNFSFEK